MSTAPDDVAPLLGKMFDTEIGVMFGMPGGKVRAWRVAAGIPAVCRTCRLAQRAGRVNRCPRHTQAGKAAQARELSARGNTQPVNVAALRAKADAADTRARAAWATVDALLDGPLADVANTAGAARRRHRPEGA